MHIAHRIKHVLHLQRCTPGGFFQLMGQYIEQNLGVALGIDMPVVIGKQLCLQGVRIGQVAVVDQHNAKRRIHVERLGLLLTEGVARRGVAHLAQTAVARQGTHIAGSEHVFDQALGLVHKELAIHVRHDTGCILTAMLQQQQSVIDQLVNRSFADNANDSTHVSIPFRIGVNICQTLAATGVLNP